MNQRLQVTCLLMIRQILKLLKSDEIKLKCLQESNKLMSTKSSLEKDERRQLDFPGRVEVFMIIQEHRSICLHSYSFVLS